MSNNISEYNRQAELNKNAFDEVIGDPFKVDREGNRTPQEGELQRLKRRSTIMVARNDFDSGRITRNTASPRPDDFYIDVERAVDHHFAGDLDALTKFEETYILESTEDHYTPRQRMWIEQKLGKLFRERRISPVHDYFHPPREGHFSKRSKQVQTKK
jgi:hypothetical protein